MAKHHVSRMVPALLHPEIAARNGRLPTAAQFYRVAGSYNQIACRQKKLILCATQNLASMVSGPTADAWHHYWRTGENFAGMRYLVGLTLSDAAPGSPPVASVIVNRVSDGAQVINYDFYFKGVTTGTSIAAGEIHHVDLPFSAATMDLDPNTEYRGQILASNGVRVCYMTVVESITRYADDTIAVIVNPARFVREGPVLASQFVDLKNAANQLWRHNASHLFSWVPRYFDQDAANPATASTTFTDLIANSAAAYIDTTNRGTLQRPNAIPVKMAVRARRTAGTGTADFRLFDGTNSIQISAAAIASTSAWFTGTGTMSGTPATWRMQHRTSVGTTTVQTSAWSLFQFEA